MQQAEIDAFQFVGQDIPWLLNHWAEAAPDRPFLVWEPRSGEDRTWTYRQFVDDVEKVASALVARGVQLGDKVLIHAENCPEAVVMWYAVARVGGDAVDVKDGDDELPVSIDTEGDVETPSELCSRVWGRLVACGHFYTFPTFEQVCADFTPAETETLRTCSVRPCAGLFTCVRDELHVPVGGN